MLSDQIRQLAEKEGIDVIRIVHTDPFEGYLLSNSPRRDPHLTLSEACSLIIVGIYIGGFTLDDWDNPSIGRTSRLFLSGFFLDVVEPLKSILALLHREGFSAQVCDGFEPEGSILPLKLAAVRAGIGWQGKHTLAVSRHYGSFLALGGVVTDARFEPDTGTEEDRCGNCLACQEACPTGALDEPYRLRRERCVSHLILEEPLSQKAHSLMGNRVVDCEICQVVCPWNKRHIEKPLKTMRIRSFRERINYFNSLFRLSNLAKLSEQDYEKLIGPFRADIPYNIFRRNVVAALGHSKQREKASVFHWPEIR